MRRVALARVRDGRTGSTASSFVVGFFFENQSFVWVFARRVDDEGGSDDADDDAGGDAIGKLENADDGVDARHAGATCGVDDAHVVVFVVSAVVATREESGARRAGRGRRRRRRRGGERSAFGG